MKHFKAYPFGRRLESVVGPHPLDGVLTPERTERFRQVLARRITRLTVVVENCWDPHNATAVLRTCEAFGVHALHVITSRNSFRVNRRISQGAHRYVNLVEHRDTSEAIRALREDGFRILVTDLSSDAARDPHDLRDALDRHPLALVFGNEESGVSEEAKEAADGRFFIPMAGFVQSLNLSVTVAVSLFSIRHRELAQESQGDMSAAEQRLWYDRWVRRQACRRSSGGDRDAAREPCR